VSVGPNGTPGESGSLKFSPAASLLVLGLVLAAGSLGLDLVVADAARGIGTAQLLGLTLGALTMLAALAGRRMTRAADLLSDGATLGVLALEIAALVAIMRYLHIESPAFYDRVAPLVLAGFIGHHLVPRRWRLEAFIMLSASAVVLVFGWRGGAWLLGLGLALVAVCRLPVAMHWRIGLLLVAGTGLALARAGVVQAPWPASIWAILASMFMFRLIAYLYDLKHARTPVGWRETLAYFFLLPNVAFPLFPVVDFATFRRTYYDQPAFPIYQQGVQWMARGLVHLIAYRLVYQHLTVQPAEVTDLADFVQYVSANFGLYLRVSGQFHLVVGILHLFGFRLPETHRLFYLASSLPDFWRRINIYWKDFMQKVVFNPVHFRLRRFGDAAALTGATLAVFLVTWATHSYQWFWLLGTWLFSLTDALFWGTLAVLMVFAGLRALRRPAARPTTERRPPLGRLRLALGASATFLLISLLWSLWTSPTLGDWLALVRAARPTLAGIALAIGVLAAVAAASLLVQWRGSRPVTGPVTLRLGIRQSALAALPLAVIVVVSLPGVARRVGGPTPMIARDLVLPELNRGDAALLQRGYYERLVGINRFNGELWAVLARRDRDWPRFRDVGALQPTGDFRGEELRPYLALMIHGASLRTNQWGMRDLDYAQQPAPGVARIALLGPSYVLGDGVADGETFEALAEAELTHDPPPPWRGVEILNFGQMGYSSLEQLVLLETGRVFRLHPHAVVLVARNETDHVRDQLVAAVLDGTPIPFDSIAAIVAAAGVTRDVAFGEGQRRLSPHMATVMDWIYGRFADRCRAAGVVPVWAYLTMPREAADTAINGALERKASSAGMVSFSMADVYNGRDGRALTLSQWDNHPNAEGHRMIAKRFESELRSRPEIFAALAQGR
jgi:D-alanyl-lipoteichoic acid acyltransferase DltB (MBOAT superfamily)